MILSSAFQDDGQIPSKYTDDGAWTLWRDGYAGVQDVSPPLVWSDVPAQAKSLVLIVNDPAPTDELDDPLPEPRVHWVLYNIPPSASALPEGISGRRIGRPDPPGAFQSWRELPAGTLEGVNGWEQTYYRGPCPDMRAERPESPLSGPHHYFFKLYALDIELPDLGRPSEAKIWEQVRGGPASIIAWAELVGTYQRLPWGRRWRE